LATTWRVRTRSQKHEEQGRTAEAIQSYQQVIEQSRNLGGGRLTARAYDRLGNLYSSLDRYAEALSMHQQAQTLWRQLSDEQKGLADSLLSAGGAYRGQGQYALAIQNFQQAANVYSQLNETNGLAKSSQQYGLAANAYSQSISAWTTLNEQDRIGTAYAQISSAYLASKQYPQALQNMQQAITFARNSNDRALEARVLDLFGQYYSENKNYAESKNSYQQAIAIWQQLGESNRAAKSIKRIGYADESLISATISQAKELANIDRFAEADQAYVQAVAAAQNSQNSKVIAKAHQALADFQASQERYHDAISNYQQAYTAWLAEGNPERATRSLTGQWRAYVALNQYNQAIAISNQAMGFMEPANGATVGGSVDISGLAIDPNFRKWQLDILLFGDNQRASFIAVSSRPVWGRFTTKNLSVYPDGNHILRLRVVRNDYNYDEYFVPITINNALYGTPIPGNGFSQPSGGDSVSGTVSVRGQANVPNFRKWQVDLLLSGDEQNVRFVRTGRTPAQDGAYLAGLDTTQYPNGNHVLRLRIVRSDGNYDEYFTNIVINN